MTEPASRTYCDIELRPIKNATKVKIIEASIELFSLRGFSGASIRDIVKEVGIKESSLYKHFKSKDEILETIFVNFRAETDKLLPPMDRLDWIADNLSLLGFMERGIENFIEHIDDPVNQKVWRIMYSELFRHPVAADIYRNGIMKRTIDCLTAVFEGMQRRGKLGALNPAALAAEYQSASITLILDYNLRKSEGASTEEIDHRIKEHVRFYSEIVGEK